MLYRLGSNWSRTERERLNINWSIIENYLSNLQGQINLLTGDVNVQELIDELNRLLNDGTIILGELESFLNNATEIITNAQSATDNANDATQSALNAINDIQSMIDNFHSKGTYDNDTVYYKNNSVFHEGSSYIFINNTPGKGNPPPNYPTVANDHWQMTAAKGASGDGAVSKVNGKEPDGTGEVTLTPSDIGATSNTEFNEHLAEKTITTKTAARTISVTGAQQIVFRQGLKGVNILAVIDGTNVTSNGYAALDDNTTTQHCLSTTPDGYRLISTTGAIVIRQSSVDTAVAIANISDDTLTLNWTKFNGNPDATVNLLITAFYHGDGG